MDALVLGVLTALLPLCGAQELRVAVGGGEPVTVYSRGAFTVPPPRHDSGLWRFTWSRTAPSVPFRARLDPRRDEVTRTRQLSRRRRQTLGARLLRGQIRGTHLHPGLALPARGHRPGDPGDGRDPPLVDTEMTAGRGRGKISPDETARAVIAGMERERNEIYVGKAGLLPALMRIAPSVRYRALRHG
ncbi:hypothetical protein ACIQ9E_06950 [Streptomyces sp. NPDC094448]|uniref:hypothetical protein n=1 Tax=Streptomyces sp. NPDC094448 TaxID=3366063 RepID=UPI0038193623